MRGFTWESRLRGRGSTLRGEPPQPRPEEPPMPVETDTSSAKFAEYSEPGRLVTADWLEPRLGSPGLVVVESDEDVLLYETGHIPGAVKVDWHTELNDPVIRD